MSKFATGLTLLEKIKISLDSLLKRVKILEQGGGTSVTPYIQITQANAVDAETNQTIDPNTIGMTYEIQCTGYSLFTKVVQDPNSGLYLFDRSCTAFVQSLGLANGIANSFVTTDNGFGLLTLKSSSLELNSTPMSIIAQMVASTFGIGGYNNIYVGYACDISINPDCQGWNGVRIGDGTTISCSVGSKLVNLSIDEGITCTFPSSVGQTNDAWSGHVGKYDSDVDVILPVLGSGASQIALVNYASFGGNFYQLTDVAGNDIANITGGEDKRNYRIFNANDKALFILLNIGNGVGNIYGNIFVLGIPYNLPNTNINASDNVSIVFNDSNCLIKSVEIY